LFGCIIKGGTTGIQSFSNGWFTLDQSTIYGCSGQGITIAINSLIGPITISNTIISSCGSFGIQATGLGNYSSFPIAGGYNVYYNNNGGGANLSGITATATDITVTVDPLTNATGGDFSVNNTAGGGAAIRGLGFPGVFPGVSTTGYATPGAVQPQASAGVSGGSYTFVG
jgi:hypothetical protein